MRGSTGILLIAIAILALYVVLSDKYSCFVQFIDCLTGNDYNTPEGFTRSITPASPNQTDSNNSGFDIWGMWKNLMKPLPNPMIKN